MHRTLLRAFSLAVISTTILTTSTWITHTAPAAASDERSAFVLTVFPHDSVQMRRVAQQSNIPLEGPHPALVVQGDDEVGALVQIHEKLSDANVHVTASTGVADGRGGYGYIIYVRPDEHQRAAEALGV